MRDPGNEVNPSDQLEWLEYELCFRRPVHARVEGDFPEQQIIFVIWACSQNVINLVH